MRGTWPIGEVGWSVMGVWPGYTLVGLCRETLGCGTVTVGICVGGLSRSVTLTPPTVVEEEEMAMAVVLGAPLGEGAVVWNWNGFME